MTVEKPKRSPNTLHYLRDVRVLQVLGQILFIIVMTGIIVQLVNTAASELRSNNLIPNYSFLNDRAGFDISESPDWYSPDSSYGTALRVGILNTFRVVILGLMLATLVGVFVGIFLLSRNWLIRTISRVYVEILRNTPLLVQLFVWYYIVLFTLPQPRDALTVPQEGVLFLSLRLVLYVIAYFLLSRFLRPGTRTSSRKSSPRTSVMTGLFVVAVVTEALFYMAYRQPMWADIYRRAELINGPFLLYGIISIALIVGAFSVRSLLRPYALGVSIGQFIAGLLFYFGIMTDASLRFETYPAVMLSIRGIALPQVMATPRIAAWLIFVTIGVVLAAAMWVYFGQITETTGRAIPRFRYAVLSVIGFTLIGWIAVSIAPLPPNVLVQQDDGISLMPLEDALAEDLLSLDEQVQYSTLPVVAMLPQQNQLGRYVVGSEISPEYVALLLGLVVYTSAFIAEIVRAGIQAVPWGQVEAARAVGLTQNQTLSLIIMPQALRVIIPPLGNQYLNLAKNSSLGIAIGFFETFNTTTTIMNQSGQSITGITLIMAIYLTMSLTISLVMNWVNGRFQLVTR